MDWIGAGELAAMGTAVLWTLSAVAWTSAGRDVGALSVSFLRLIVACGYLLIYFLYGRAVYGQWLPAASPHAWRWLLASGFVGFFLADVFLFKAFVMVGPRITLLIQALVAPIAAVTAWTLFADPLTARQWAAMAVTLAGVAWVVLERSDPTQGRHTPREIRWGLLLAFGAAIGQGAGLVLSKQGLDGCDAASATFIRILGALAGFVPMITLMRRWPGMFQAARQPRAMGVVALGAFIGPFLGVILSMVALQHAHPGVVGTILATMPILILPFAVFLYREKVSPRAAIGAVVAVIGVAMLKI